MYFSLLNIHVYLLTVSLFAQIMFESYHFELLTFSRSSEKVMF